MTDNDESAVITGKEKIEAYRLLTIRTALKLETLGMRRHGRSARVLANEVMGTKFRTAKTAYEAFDQYLVEKHGAVSRPLPEKKEKKR